jgi:hypothetical protein
VDEVLRVAALKAVVVAALASGDSERGADR